MSPALPIRGWGPLCAQDFLQPLLRFLQNFLICFKTFFKKLIIELSPNLKFGDAKIEGKAGIPFSAQKGVFGRRKALEWTPEIN